MNKVEIPLSEYNTYDKTPKFGIQSKFWPIYCFYKKHTQQNYYHICLPEGTELTRIIEQQHVSLYATYGINFSDHIDMLKQSRLFVSILKFSQVSDEQTFNESVVNKVSAIDPADVGLVFVEYDSVENVEELSMELRLDIAARIENLYPNAILCNSELAVFVASVIDQKPQYESSVSLGSLITVDELLKGINSYSKVASIIIPMLRIIEKVHTCKCDMIDASTEDSADITKKFSVGNRMVMSYICLMKYNKVLYFCRSSQKALYSLPQQIMKQHAMYADEYLNMIANFPDATIYHKVDPFIAMPDRSQGAYHKISVQLISTEINEEDMSLMPGQYKARYEYEDLELVHVTELFKLDSSNTAEAISEMKRLQELLQRFEYRCGNIIDMTEILLNVSNILFYRINDKLYIGYVAYIDAKIPFVMYPIRKISKPFRTRLDVTKEVFHDVRFYEDWKEVITPYVLNGLVNVKRLFFKPPKYIKGLCMYGINSAVSTIDDTLGLTFEEVGMLSDACWDLRKSPEILNYVKRSCIATRMATPFGGLHPMISTNFRIDREDWRSDADKIQQRNTYGY